MDLSLKFLQVLKRLNMCEGRLFKALSNSISLKMLAACSPDDFNTLSMKIYVVAWQQFVIKQTRYHQIRQIRCDQILSKVNELWEQDDRSKPKKVKESTRDLFDKVILVSGISGECRWIAFLYTKTEYVAECRFNDKSFLWRCSSNKVSQYYWAWVTRYDALSSWNICYQLSSVDTYGCFWCFMM